MIKKVLVLSLLLLKFISPQNIKAETDFYVDADVIYEVKETGVTEATFNLELINAGDERYATEYILNLEGIKPDNVSVIYQGRDTPFSLVRNNNNYSIKVEFDDLVVGKGTSRALQIYFSEGTFATRTGEVWEIAIPRLSKPNTFRDYSISLSVPKSFGNEAFISPEANKFEEKTKTNDYFFQESEISNTGISAGFGKFQVFNFSLKYHLENPLNEKSDIEIAIPPDTAFQKLYYKKIDPTPINVSIDNDGNWLAKYILEPRERLDVSAEGSVQVFSSPISSLSTKSIKKYKYLERAEYWESDNEELKVLANQLKTPERIYQFVSSNLKYDYKRVNPNVQRMGALNALKNKNSAICMEYTDLFIALARAAGIPAREINGFAYTENPEIQPLSLVADVLHAWPEYWNENLKTWIPVDPTWGSTTGGVDYFSRLDLRHFAFVIHGESSTMPYAPGSYKLGPNPQKDVFVNFGELPINRRPELEIVVEKRQNFPLLSPKIYISIKNVGSQAIRGVKPTVVFDGEIKRSDYVEVIPPYSKYEMQVDIPFSLFGTKTPESVQILAKDKFVTIPTLRGQIVILNLITILFFLIILVLTILQKTGRLNLFHKRFYLSKKVIKGNIKELLRKFGADGKNSK